MKCGRFTRAELEAAGFEGWQPFSALLESDGVPAVGGVYAIWLEPPVAPDFLEANPGGRFKGKDPSVSAEVLEANWVTGAEVVYLGKADVLRRRLRDFARFGAGRPVGHWGGRLIWQHARSADYLVAWCPTPGQVPVDVETDLIADFRSIWGKPPFANDPHLLGR